MISNRFHLLAVTGVKDPFSSLHCDPPFLFHVSQQNTSLQVRAGQPAATPPGGGGGGREEAGGGNLPDATASGSTPQNRISYNFSTYQEVGGGDGFWMIQAHGM